jgi:hypothetical protein
MTPAEAEAAATSSPPRRRRRRRKERREAWREARRDSSLGSVP